MTQTSEHYLNPRLSQRLSFTCYPLIKASQVEDFYWRVIKKRPLLVVHIVLGSGLELQDTARTIQHNQTDDKANHQVWIT